MKANRRVHNRNDSKDATICSGFGIPWETETSCMLCAIMRLDLPTVTGGFPDRERRGVLYEQFDDRVSARTLMGVAARA